MWKNIIILALVLLGVGYVVADKPIIRVIETRDNTVDEELPSKSSRSRVIVTVIFGMGNTLNFNAEKREA